MIITVKSRLSNYLRTKSASTRRIYVYDYGKCGRRVLKMLDRVGYSPIRDPIHYGTTT